MSGRCCNCGNTICICAELADYDSQHQRRLQALTIPERISAAARHYEPLDPGFAAGLRHAAEIAGPDGWQHIAPAWADVGEGAE